VNGNISSALLGENFRYSASMVASEKAAASAIASALGVCVGHSGLASGAHRARQASANLFMAGIRSAAVVDRDVGTQSLGTWRQHRGWQQHRVWWNAAPLQITYIN